MIGRGGDYEDYELVEYVNDVNRENEEVLLELNINGRMHAAYSYGNERLTAESYTRWTGYYTYDPRGSVSGITGQSGWVVQSYRYSVNGEMTFGKPRYDNVYGYNAESYNPNTGLQYLRARYYNVGTAAFISEDSYLGDIRDPLSLNRYNYTKSSPLNYVDQSGYWGIPTESHIVHTGDVGASNPSNAGADWDKWVDSVGTKLTTEQKTILKDNMRTAEAAKMVQDCNDAIELDDSVYDFIESVIMGALSAYTDNVLSGSRYLLNLAGGEFYTASELLETVAKNKIGFYIGKLIGDVASILTGLKLLNSGGEMAASGVALIASGGGVGEGIVVTAGGVVIAGEGFTMTVSGGVDFVISMDGLSKEIVYTSQGKGATSEEKGKGEAGNSLKKVKNNKEANKVAKEFGYKGAEELKQDFVFKDGAKFNMMIDTETGEVVLVSIKDSSIQVHTGLFR